MPPSLTSINFTKSFFACVLTPRRLAFVANLFLQWKAVNQYPYRAVILGSGASRSRASSFFAFAMLFRFVRIERDRVREENPLRQRKHDDLAIGLVEREGRLVHQAVSLCFKSQASCPIQT